MANELIRLGDREFSLMPRILMPSVRADVRALGRFVRLVEAIAGNPMLSRGERRARLRALEISLSGDPAPAEVPAPGPCEPGPSALLGEDRAVMLALRESIERTRVSPDYAGQVLRSAHRIIEPDTSAVAGQADPPTNASWDDVLACCDGIAAPVGRHLLALHGENVEECGPAADALCMAMWILKALRDCEAPITRNARLCIPDAYLHDASISPRHLRAPAAKGQTRAVIDRVLDGVERLLADAEVLPHLLRGRRLRAYVSIVLCRAGKLSARFRQRDPLREKVGLSRWQRLSCTMINVFLGVVRP